MLRLEPRCTGGREQGGGEGGKERKEGQLERGRKRRETIITQKVQKERKEQRKREIFLPIHSSTYRSIYPSPPLAFKTSVLLTLIACRHIFIPQKALEKPMLGWGKWIRIGFCLPWPQREVGLPTIRSEWDQFCFRCHSKQTMGT